MEIIVKHFDELTTRELYEILKTRFEIFVTEQECIMPANAEMGIFGDEHGCK